MAAQVTLDCPHCKTVKIAFSYKYHAQKLPGLNLQVVFLQCGGCGEGVFAHIPTSHTAVSQWVGGHTVLPTGITRIYPAPDAPKCPADIPNAVKSAFLSGLENLDRPNGANAAAMMFRRAIEMATKTVNPDAPKGHDLKTRISNLPPEVATPAMKEWAQHIRLEANEATHDVEDFSPDDARALHHFAEMFLTYAFTLPAMLDRAKADAHG